MLSASGLSSSSAAVFFTEHKNSIKIMLRKLICEQMKKKGEKEIFRHVQEGQRKRLEDDLELEKPSLVINFSHLSGSP